MHTTLIRVIFPRNDGFQYVFFGVVRGAGFEPANR
jgi:hypothetical protein